MSERTVQELRLEIAAERDGLADDLDGLRGAARPLLPVAAAGLVGVLALIVWRKLARRAKRTEPASDVQRLKLAIVLVKLLLKLERRWQRDRPRRQAPVTSGIGVAPEGTRASRHAPWPAAPSAPPQRPETRPAEVSG